MADIYDPFDDAAQGIDGGIVDPFKEGYEKPRSAVGEIGNQLKAGALVELPEMVGQAVRGAKRVLGAPDTAASRWGGRVSADAEARGQRPDLQADPSAHNALTNVLAAGARQIPQSVATIGALGTVGRVAPNDIPAMAPEIGSGVLFGLSQGQSTYDKAREKGLTDEQASDAAMATGLIEGVGETIGGHYLGKFANLLAPEARAAGQGVIKPFVKDFAKTSAVEVGTEMAQNAGEAAVEQAAGIDDMSPWEAAKESIGPTLGMTTLLAPFGLAGHVMNRREERPPVVDPIAEKSAQRQQDINDLTVAAVTDPNTGPLSRAVGLNPEASAEAGAAQDQALLAEQVETSKGSVSEGKEFAAQQAKQRQDEQFSAGIDTGLDALDQAIGAQRMLDQAGAMPPALPAPQKRLPAPEPDESAIQRRSEDLAAEKGKTAPAQPVVGASGPEAQVGSRGEAFPVSEQEGSRVAAKRAEADSISGRPTGIKVQATEMTNDPETGKPLVTKMSANWARAKLGPTEKVHWEVEQRGEKSWALVRKDTEDRAGNAAAQINRGGMVDGQKASEGADLGTVAEPVAGRAGESVVTGRGSAVAGASGADVGGRGAVVAAAAQPGAGSGTAVPVRDAAPGGDGALTATTNSASTDSSAVDAPDRRADASRRKTVAEMSPDERAQALLTHELTNIPNRRAYEEAPKKARQVSIDVDSLKAINDTGGHAAGDELLRTVAGALREEGVEAYHVSGDEFVAQGDHDDGINEAMDRVRDRLARAPMEFTGPDGDVVTVPGIGVSYGTGASLEEADQFLQRNKSEREAAGLRSPRGQLPPGANRRSAEAGIQADEGDAAPAPVADRVNETPDSFTVPSGRAKETTDSDARPGDPAPASGQPVAGNSAASELVAVRTVRGDVVRVHRRDLDNPLRMMLPMYRKDGSRVPGMGKLLHRENIAKSDEQIAEMNRNMPMVDAHGGKPFKTPMAVKRAIRQMRLNPEDFDIRGDKDRGFVGVRKKKAADQNSTPANAGMVAAPSDAGAEAASAAPGTAPEHAAANDDLRGLSPDELRNMVKEFEAAGAIAADEGVTRVFSPPTKAEIVRTDNKVKVYHKDHGWMTTAEAKAKIAEWKAHAQAQGENDAMYAENSRKVVMSFFDLTGSWSQPWEDAGYQVFRFDIQNDAEMGDVNNFSTGFFNDWFGDFGGNDVYAILAANPCTDFAVSGARHFAAKDGDGRTVKSVRLVHKTLAAIEYFKPAVWALENPVGRIEKLGGLPPWRLNFNPNAFGEDYTKRTLLWGRFNGDLPIAPTEATAGSKMHTQYGGKSMRTKNARSETPEGFAYSFFMANNAIDNPVMAVSNKYDRLDRGAVKAALDAGVTAQEIDSLVEDFYYQDLNDDAANKALRDAAAERAPSASANSPSESGRGASESAEAPTGPFGPVFSGFANQPEKAIAKLMKEKRGEVPDAFTHPELGAIAFVYGDAKMGLRHIEAKRGIKWVRDIPAILRSGRLERDPSGLQRAFIIHDSNPNKVAVIRLDWDGEQKAWLVTAHPDDEGKWSGAGKTSRTAGIQESVQGNPSRLEPQQDATAEPRSGATEIEDGETIVRTSMAAPVVEGEAVEAAHVEGGEAEIADKSAVDAAVRKSTLDADAARKDLLAKVADAADSAKYKTLADGLEANGIIFDAKSGAYSKRRPASSRKANQVLEAKAALSSIGYVDFSVPGDGTFKVLNTEDALRAFAKKVEKSAGFKSKQGKSPLPSRPPSRLPTVKAADESNARKVYGHLSDSALRELELTQRAALTKILTEIVNSKADGYTGRYDNAGGFAEAIEHIQREMVRRGMRSRTDVDAAGSTEESEEPLVEAPVAGQQPLPVAEPNAKADSAPAEGKIENFGDALPPARRDARSSLSDELSQDDIARKPLSEIWPADEIEGIEDKYTAAVAHTARESIPSKPRVAYKVKRWAEKVAIVRDLAQALVTGKITKRELNEKFRFSNSLRNFGEKVALLNAVDRGQWKRIGAVEAYPEAYSYDKEGKKHPQPHVVVTVDGKSHRFDEASSVADVVEKVAALLAGAETKAKRMLIEVRGRGDKWFINKKGDSQYRHLKDFTTSKEALEYARDPANLDDLEAAWEAIKQRDNVTERDLRGTKNRPRTAKDYRKGENVTADAFEKAFGFKGVEFGKWVSQGVGAKNRQGLLNETYDALHDLADILGIPTQAISLNGSLGLALGDRGSGWASAHFEPSNLVINLTKTRGAGTLAHEWFHALDNYFSRLRGGEVPFNGNQEAYRENNFITYKPEPAYRKKGSPAWQRVTTAATLREQLKADGRWDTGKTLSENADAAGFEPDPDHRQGVRPQVEEAFTVLVKALNDSPMSARARMLDKGKSGYWSQIIERGARSFENYVISRMMENGYHNDFLANVVDVEKFVRNKGRYPYLLPEEVKPVAEAFDNLFGTVQTRETESGTMMFDLGAKASPADVRRGQSVRKALDEKFGASGIQNLIDRGLLRIVATADQLPAEVLKRAEQMRAPRGLIRGLHDPETGRVYIVASQVTPAEAGSILLHEIGEHYGLKKMLGEPDYKKLLTQVRMNRQRDPQIRAAWATTNERYGHLKEGGDKFVQEVMARLADDSSVLDAGWFKHAVLALRRFLFRMGLRKVNAEDIRGMLAASLRRVMREEGAPTARAGAVMADRRGDLDTDSRGSKIAASPEAVANFWRWYKGEGRDGKDSGRILEGSGERNDARGSARGAGTAAEPSTIAGIRFTGESGPIDEENRPVVFFHGTDAEVVGGFDLNHPNRKDNGWLGAGVYLTSAPGTAETYAEMKAKRSGGNERIMPLYAAVKNPYFANHRLKAYLASNPAETKRFTQWATSKGYDGVAVNYGGSVELVAFNTKAVKSAVGNRGTFDPNENEVLFDLASPAAAPAIAAVRQKVGDFMDTGRTFNRWWHDTIGTQYHKAQIDKDYARVFNRTQDYLTDVSRVALAAAEKAPDILPRFDSLKDLAKAGASPRDLKGVSEAIFRGTLEDEKVYTETELRDRFRLNPKQVGLYRQARAAINRSLTDMLTTEMVKLARTDITDAVAREAAAAESPQATRDILAKHVTPELAAQLDEKIGRVAQLIQQGYAPLMRFGQYSLNVTGKDGETLFFGMYESAAERNRMQRQMAEQHPDATISAGVMNDETYQMFRGVTPETLELFANASGMGQDEAFQQYLKLTKANRSALKRLIHRKGIEGYNPDLKRVLAQFVTSNARAASANLHMGEMTRAWQAIPRDKGDVQKDAGRLIQYIQNPKEEAQTLRGFLFYNFLGGSVASAAVNMTQPFTMTFPYLAQWGAGKAARELASAMKVGFSDPKGIKDAALRAAMQRAVKEGTVEPHQIHELAAAAMRSEGDWGKFEKAREATRKVGFVWGRLFSMAEQFNRRSTFAAAFQVGRSLTAAQLQKAGVADAYAFAVKAVNETQGIYNRGNRPNWARGAVGATLFTFKQFSISYVEFLKRLPRRERLLAVGVLMLAAGVNGLPGTDDLDDLIDTLLQSLGIATGAKETRNRVLAGVLGQGGADFLQNGISEFLPLDVQGRLGMQNLIPGSGFALKSTRDTGRELSEAIGPAGGFAQNIYEGVGKLARGDVIGAMESGAPVAIQNAIKGWKMGQMGFYSDTKGRRVIDTTATDAAIKAMGFQPETVARESRQIQIQRQRIELTRTVESEIASTWAQGVFESDPQKVQAARQRLMKWNADNPESRIRIAPNQIQRRLKEMRLSRQERFVRAAPKELRQGLREQAGG